MPKRGNEVGEAIEINIRGVRGAVMGAEAVIYRRGEGAGVARGLHVHFGIADQHRFGGGGAEFAKNRPRAERGGLLGFKAVAAVDGAKIFWQTEAFEDSLADTYRVVGARL